jgi:hypothetical protein
VELFVDQIKILAVIAATGIMVVAAMMNAQSAFGQSCSSPFKLIVE